MNYDYESNDLEGARYFAQMNTQPDESYCDYYDDDIDESDNEYDEEEEEECNCSDPGCPCRGFKIGGV